AQGHGHDEDEDEDGAALLQRRLVQDRGASGCYLPSSALRVNSSFCCAPALSHFYQCGIRDRRATAPPAHQSGQAADASRWRHAIPIRMTALAQGVRVAATAPSSVRCIDINV